MFVLPTEYYQGLNIPSEFNLKEYLRVANIVECELLESMTLIRRIGSESLHAKVYIGEIDQTAIAVKKLKNPRQFENEMTINNTVFEEGSNDLYFLYLIKGLMCDDGAFLIMELAMSDVLQRIKYFLELPKDIYRTVSEVLQSLLRLARLGIYHGDLHLGNVFLVLRNGQLRTVIGDFGESNFTDSPTSSSSDLFQFLNALREKLNRSQAVMPVLNSFYERIGKIAGKTESRFDDLLEVGVDEKQAVISCNVEFVETAISEWRQLVTTIGR
jgi:serine/threonine protein kinase